MTGGQPTVCVVMPAYRAAATVGAAADSVLSQDYPNLILGIAAPARDPETLAAARAIVDPRVQVLEQTGRGIADARNLVLEAIPADLYMFLDSDDFMNPGVIGFYVRHRLATGEEGLRYGHYMEQLPDGSAPDWVRRAPFLGRVAKAFPRLCLLNFIGTGSVMIDAAVVRKVGVFERRFSHGEDWHYWLRIARQFPVFGLDVVAYRYTYGKLTRAVPYPRSFFDDGVTIVRDVRCPPFVRLLSIACIHAMYVRYFARTLKARRSLAQFTDLRLLDLLSVPPAAIVLGLRKLGIV